MHAKTFLHKLFGSAIHKMRITVLSDVITAIIRMKALKLVSVGRALDLPIQERSGIRKVDRVLGNPYYQKHSAIIYQHIINCVVGNQHRPELIVDWTKLPHSEHYALRASLSTEGRAITLYEEVHPKKKENNQAVHHQFLKRLKEMLPNGCCPIIVTDAGFKNPWFKSVLLMGWDFVGRVRGLTTYYDEQEKSYKACATLHRRATLEGNYLLDAKLTRQNPLVVSFYAVKQKLKGRRDYNKNRTVSGHRDSRGYSRSQREPWILVTSLKGKRCLAKKVMAIYRRRMTIEEAFRDLKSSRYGLSMQDNLTLKPKRLTVWLMLSALATLMAWIMGQAAEKKGLHYQFQANSYRHRRVLSFFYLGCQIIRKKLELTINLNQISFKGLNSYG